jgi:hypothetical protein
MKEARLPKWAQAELASLRHRLADAEEERDELREGIVGPADTDTHADPYGPSPINLPKGGLISFRIGHGEEDIVRARVVDEGLEVMGLTGVAVIPRASNHVVIGVRRD